jgi:photosystem II stability/assembly factor-like uncharacterized protein
MYNSPFLNRSIALMSILAMVLGGAGRAAADVPSMLVESGPESPPQDSPWGASGWTISEFQPDIPNGGRANTIAVHPDDDNIVLVASESGGLFKSKDGGLHWKHIDGLKPYYTNSVVFVPSDPKIIIATTSEDFSVSNQGGIWRSEDEGETWAPVLWQSSGFAGPNTKPKPSPSPPGVTARYSAFEISIAPDTGRIYVASTAGVEVGTVDGKTWIHRNLDAAALPTLSVLALPEAKPGDGNTVLVGSAAGVWRSVDGGKGWGKITPGPGCTTLNQPAFVKGCIMDLHAFGGSPLSKTQAYVVNGDKELHSSTDGGQTWTPIWQTPKFDAGCGGIAFIQAKPSTQQGSLDLYVGDRCGVFKRTVSPLPGTNTYNYDGTWTPLASDHGDTRHIAFAGNNAPLFLATDGGVHKTSEGGQNFKFIGGGKGGYNALQIYQVRGQWIDSLSQYNLYFGTQDNGLFSSTDDGKTWVQCGGCNEGDFFDAAYHAATPEESQITTSPSVNFILSGISFVDGKNYWPNPPGAINNIVATGRPKFVKKNFHVQWVEDAAIFIPSPTGAPVLTPVMSRGLAVTYTLGKHTDAYPLGWQQYALINDTARCGNCTSFDLPRVSYPQKGGPVIYQMLAKTAPNATALEQGALARVLPKLNATDATTDYPAMKISGALGSPPATNFGGFGIPPTMEGWFRVFAVDPADPNHLLAPDIIN